MLYKPELLYKMDYHEAKTPDNNSVYSFCRTFKAVISNPFSGATIPLLVWVYNARPHVCIKF